MEQNELQETNSISITKDILQSAIVINQSQLQSAHQVNTFSIDSQNDELEAQQILNINENLSYEFHQPETHKKSKNFCEKYFLFCFGTNRDLTREEIKLFNDLKYQSNISVDKNDQHHLQMIRSLFYILKGEEIQEIINKDWKFYGFQNENPISDFRGGGLLSLKHLIFYCQKYTEKVNDEFCLETNDFLFAISSINITYFIKVFFHLAIFVDYQKHQSEICNRNALQSFCLMLKENQSTSCLIHNMLLDDIFLDWLHLKSKVKTTTIMDFNPVLIHLQQKFKTCIQKKVYTNFKDFEQHYKRYSKRDRK